MELYAKILQLCLLWLEAVMYCNPSLLAEMRLEVAILRKSLFWVFVPAWKWKITIGGILFSTSPAQICICPYQYWYRQKNVKNHYSTQWFAICMLWKDLGNRHPFFLLYRSRTYTHTRFTPLSYAFWTWFIEFELLMSIEQPFIC